MRRVLVLKFPTGSVAVSSTLTKRALRDGRILSERAAPVVVCPERFARSDPAAVLTTTSYETVFPATLSGQANERRSR